MPSNTAITWLTSRWTGRTRAIASWVSQYVYPQVALVALNPHTGQVLALVGGRSYGTFAGESRSGGAAHGLNLQALRVCCCLSDRR